MNEQVIKDGIIFTKSNRKNKKYRAEFKNGTVLHFGDLRYQHYHDKIGLYNYLDHYDAKRRKLYKLRHIKPNNKKTPGYLAWHYLW